MDDSTIEQIEKIDLKLGDFEPVGCSDPNCRAVGMRLIGIDFRQGVLQLLCDCHKISLLFLNQQLNQTDPQPIAKKKEVSYLG